MKNYFTILVHDIKWLLAFKDFVRHKGLVVCDTVFYNNMLFVIFVEEVLKSFTKSQITSLKEIPHSKLKSQKVKVKVK